MIGFFIKSGGQKASEEFSPYIFGENGLRNALKVGLQNKHYSSELNLILIKFYVDGEIVKFPIKQRRLSNYSSKNRDIAVDCFINDHNFFNRNELERRLELIKAISTSIPLVRTRLDQKITLDWDSLKQDVESILTNWKDENPATNKVQPSP